ncbi:BCCT family transporter [uncultured Dialister sp.]|uniref:BCCT family transporter n=1 Tax=uncultured Dialister sp. TaxID=278064 RepID=UPI0027DB7995|nr:BCCT family transporter [uncultured Dialister sp.]
MVPEGAKAVLTFLKQELFNSFSWIYILSVAFFLFLVVLCLGKLGEIRLGDDDEEPAYSFFSWLCMLFSAGMGIGLMYFGVAEPISHLSAPLHSMASPVVQTRLSCRQRRPCSTRCSTGESTLGQSTGSSASLWLISASVTVCR